MIKNLFLLFLLFLISCSFSSPKDKLIIFDLKSSGMGIGPDGKVLAIENHARVAIKDSMELYITPIIRSYSKIVADGNGGFTNGKPDKVDTIHVIFVKKKNQQTGIKYILESIDSIPGSTINADSLWATLTFYSKSIENFSKDIGTPVQIIEKGSTRIEKYAMPHQIGQVDTIYRYYDKSMKHIPYSFSEKLDKQQYSKLVRIYGIANELPKGEAMPDATIPRREFYHEMKAVKEKNLKKYTDIFKKFEEDSKKLHLK